MSSPFLLMRVVPSARRAAAAVTHRWHTAAPQRPTTRWGGRRAGEDAALLVSSTGSCCAATRSKVHVTGYEDNVWFGPNAGKVPGSATGQEKLAGAASRLQGRQNQAAASTADSRFQRKVADFREVQDGDAYAGLFKERESVSKLRVKTWQQQFEKENEGVELPYERTNFIFRTTPNWFVRMMIRVRNDGIPDVNVFYGIMLLAFSICMIFMSTTEPIRGEERDTSEIK